MRRMYSHQGEYRKIFLANYLCIGFMPGGSQKLVFKFFQVFDSVFVRRFPMEPFLETLWGPLVPISAYLCPLGVAILRY